MFLFSPDTVLRHVIQILFMLTPLAGDRFVGLGFFRKFIFWLQERRASSYLPKGSVPPIFSTYLPVRSPIFCFTLFTWNEQSQSASGSLHFFYQLMAIGK